MTESVEISRGEARALLGSTLRAPAGAEADGFQGATGLSSIFSRVRVIQMDPVRRVAESHHISLALRVPGYRPHALEAAERDACVAEVRAHERSLVPIGDLPLYMPRMRLARERLGEEEARVSGTVREVLDRLERDGPLPSRAFAVDPRSRVEGFWDRPGEPRTQAAALALEILWAQGRVTVVRENGTRIYDLPERRWPATVWNAAAWIEPEEARRGRLLAYLGAVGIASARGPRLCLDRSSPAERAAAVDWAVGTGRAVTVRVAEEGNRPPLGGLLVLRERLDELPEGGRDAASRGVRASRLLPPLDNLLWQRDLVRDLLDLAYRWEVYLPASRRAIGPYGMPVWTGDALAGQVDARLDRSTGRLVGRFYPTFRARERDRKRDVRSAERALGDLACRLTRIEGRPVVAARLEVQGATERTACVAEPEVAIRTGPATSGAP